MNSVDLQTQKALEIYQAEEYVYGQEVPDGNRNADAEMNVPMHALPWALDEAVPALNTMKNGVKGCDHRHV